MGLDSTNNNTESLDASFSTAGLKVAVRGGAGIATVAHALSQLISLAILAILFRLIAPEQFGLLAMVMPLLVFFRHFGMLGLNVATVQRQTLSAGQVSSLFWLNLLLGLLTAAVTAACAPLLVWFFNRPELAWLTVALAGTAVVATLGAQHHALLERNLRMAPLAVSRLISQLCAATAAVSAAWAGMGVWALVIQLYVELAAFGLLVWLLEPWRPKAPTRGEPVGELVRFGGAFTAASLLFALAQNIDKVLVGFALGAATLGLYSQAFNVMMKPVYLLTVPLAGVMLPGLSRAAHDPASYRLMLLAFSRLIAVVTIPAGVGLFLVAPEVMQLLGGDAWAEAGPILRVLSLAIGVQGFVNVAGSFFTSAGRARRLLVAASGMALFLCLAFFVGLGIGWLLDIPTLGVAGGYSFGMLLLSGPYMLYCLRSVDASPRKWLAEIRRPALCALGMGLVVAVCRWSLLQIEGLSPLSLLSVQVTVGVAVYAILARKEIRWFVDQLRLLRQGASTA